MKRFVMNDNARENGCSWKAAIPCRRERRDSSAGWISGTPGRRPGRSFKTGLWLAALLLAAWPAAGGESGGPAKDPIKEDYAGYKPDFIDLISRNSGYGGAATRFAVPEENMKLSSEHGFYTLNLTEESDRANALVEAAIAREKAGRYQEAVEIYQKVLDGYGDCLYRVSEYGVFVPVGQYCQRRMLNIPQQALSYYRTKYDSRARDPYEVARQKNSVEGLAHIRDNLLATSYGAPSLMTLGSSALDQGHFLEALEYFETVWNYFPEQRTKSPPELALSVALCRKMLGLGTKGGERYGLVGHWKLDETGGNKAADSSGCGNDGLVAPAPQWTQGKLGGALQFSRTNSVSVPGSARLTIGEGGSGFSVAFWMKWEKEGTPFTKGGTADDMLSLAVVGKNQLGYTIATQSRQFETGNTKGSVGVDRWTHVAFVKAGDSVKIFLDGRLDLRESLKAPALRNAGGVTLGQWMFGCLDDVRLYNRELLDREVTELAGAVGAATMTASPASGEAPLTVEFAATGAEGECWWEFGDGETAAGPKVRHSYGLGGDYPARLTVTDPKGNVAVAQTTIAVTWRPKDQDFVKRMGPVLADAKPDPSVARYQRASAPNAAADDYAPFPPTDDPLALKPLVWSERLPMSRGDFMVFAQPVATGRSIIYRHKNIVYCRSILNGELRWKNDMGGRVTWQSPPERQYPQEDLLVQDGLVFTPMQKVGPSLVALDETTGQMRWAHGPMVAATSEEARMRLESAPASGPGAVYAGYIMDNIEGETHTDTEYGVVAFESTTGRMLWQTRLCRLRPGKFSSGFAEARRNRIRSFSSPPLYHEGTLYYCTNAGAIAALDALSGRVKWLMRYPYYPSVHDASRVFPAPHFGYEYRNNPWRPHGPMFWFNQRPLLLGDRLVVLPVDTAFMLCLERKAGKVEWSQFHPGSYTHVVGPTEEGYLVRVNSANAVRGTVTILDPAHGGSPVWTAPSLVLHDDQPVMKYQSYGPYGHWGGGINWARNDVFQGSPMLLGARPFLTTDGHLYVTTWLDFNCSVDYMPPWCFTLTDLSLRERKILGKRRYYTGEILVKAGEKISQSPTGIEELEQLPNYPDRERTIREMKEVAADHVPVNKYGPFLPFSRVTVERFGILFELRFGAQDLGVLYDVAALDKALAGRTDPDAEFAKAELAINRTKYEEASGRLNRCLTLVSAEDLDFRTQVNQQLYGLNKRLARASVQSGLGDKELEYALAMTRSVTQLSEEIETLLVLAEANERRGDFATAARQLQSVVETYGPYEYPIPALMAGDSGSAVRTAEAIIGRATGLAARQMHAAELTSVLDLERKGLPVYLSMLSPLDKDLMVRAGDLAIGKLLGLEQRAKAFAASFGEQADKALTGKPAAEQSLWIRSYPGTKAAQSALEGLLKTAAEAEANKEAPLNARAECRRQMWALADLARVCGLELAEGYRARLLAPAGRPKAPALAANLERKTASIEDERGMAWLAAPRRDDGQLEPDLMFLAGRVKKRLDNKFVLYGWDLKAGKITWKATEPRGDQWFDELRLDGKGDEPGFHSVYVHGDLAVTHGLFDVLAFGLKDGRLRWRYRVPHDFEIRESLFSGDLMILQGKAETVALYVPTEDPRGEVAWQEKEEGDLYNPGYLVGDRLVSVRKMPFNVTVRYRGTGKLMGRLTVPDLLLEDGHPLVEDGPRELPATHDGKLLALTDGFYYMMVDVEKMKVVWKRLIDANDPTREPKMRLALGGEYLAVLKEDFDKKALYMLSSRTGAVLWPLKKLDKDGKDAGSIEGSRPMHELYVQGERLYGIIPHEGQGFYLACVDCKTGKNVFPPHEEKEYDGRPEVTLVREDFGARLAVMVKDRQDYELKVFEAAAGKLQQTLNVKGMGDFGVHGAVSATVQNGKLALLGQNDLVTAAGK